MISFEVRNIILNAAIIEEKLKKAEIRGLKRIGFLTRQASQQSIRDGAGASAPGTPPHSHTGTLRRFILYSLSDDKKSVVIGPKFLKKKSKDAAKATEYGGRAVNSRSVPINVQPRSFMHPALEKVSRENVPGVFGNSFR